MCVACLHVYARAYVRHNDWVVKPNIGICYPIPVRACTLWMETTDIICK